MGHARHVPRFGADRATHRLNVFAHALNELGKNRANVQDVFIALRDVYKRCKGAFACTAMIAGFGIMGFRWVTSTLFNS
jgi:glutamine phosphoribosylpyrophosphate amidotransferase